MARVSPLADLEPTEADDAIERNGLRDVLKVCMPHFVLPRLETIHYGHCICLAESTNHNCKDSQIIERIKSDIRSCIKQVQHYPRDHTRLECLWEVERRLVAIRITL